MRVASDFLTKIYVRTYVYHESTRTWYVYMSFHVLLVIIGIGNDYVILFIYLTKV